MFLVICGLWIFCSFGLWSATLLTEISLNARSQMREKKDRRVMVGVQEGPLSCLCLAYILPWAQVWLSAFPCIYKCFWIPWFFIETLFIFSCTLLAVYHMLQHQLLPQMTAGFLFGFSGVPARVSSELGEKRQASSVNPSGGHQID